MKTLLLGTLATALLALGGCSSVNRGVAWMQHGNCAKAIQSFLPPARAGDKVAQYDMGVVWEKGCPTADLAASNDEAFKWYHLSAQQSFPSALYAVGRAYDYGLGVNADGPTAIAWYKLAARRGSPKARQKLVSLRLPVPALDQPQAPTSSGSGSGAGSTLSAVALAYLLTNPGRSVPAETLGPPPSSMHCLSNAIGSSVSTNCRTH